MWSLFTWPYIDSDRRSRTPDRRPRCSLLCCTSDRGPGSLLRAVGCWRLIAEGWCPIVGSWRLIAEGWWPMAGSWRLIAEGWCPIVGSWRLIAVGWWPIIVGSWKLIGSRNSGWLAAVTNGSSPFSSYSSSESDFTKGNLISKYWEENRVEKGFYPRTKKDVRQ